MERKITILLLLFTTFLYSQNIMTKFIRKGNLNDVHTDQLHKFKKNDVVFLIMRLDDNRWQVNTKGHTGYVTSPYLKLTDDIMATVYQKEQKEKLLIDEKKREQDQDSIDYANSLKMWDNYQVEGFKLAEIERKRREDSIKENIEKYAADSLLILNIGGNIKIYQGHNSPSESYILKDKQDYYFLDYENNNYIVYSKSKGAGRINWAELYKQYQDNSNNPQYQLARSLLKSKEKKEKKIKLAKQKADLAKKNAYLAKKKNDYIKKYGQSTYSKLKKGYYWIGMTDEMAKIAGYYPGRDNVNRSVGSWGVHEQWVCRNDLFLYFENGVLTSYQN